MKITLKITTKETVQEVMSEMWLADTPIAIYPIITVPSKVYFNYQICSKPSYHLILCKYTDYQYTSLSNIILYLFLFSLWGIRHGNTCVSMFTVQRDRDIFLLIKESRGRTKHQGESVVIDNLLLRRNLRSSIFLAVLHTDTHCIPLFKCPSNLKEAKGSGVSDMLLQAPVKYRSYPIDIWTTLFCINLDWPLPGTWIHTISCGRAIVE